MVEWTEFLSHIMLVKHELASSFPPFVVVLCENIRPGRQQHSTECAAQSQSKQQKAPRQQGKAIFGLSVAAPLVLALTVRRKKTA